MRLAKIILLTLLISSFFLSGCSKCGKCKKKAEGVLFVQGRFNSIDFILPGKITLIEDSELTWDQLIISRGPQSHLEALNKSVDGTGKWTVIYGGCVEEGCADVDLLVVIKDFKHIQNLTVSGSGLIFADSSLVSENLTITIDGSGEVRMEKLSATNLIANILGSGKLDLTGGGTNVNLSMTGSGNFEGYNYPAQNYTVNHSGSGSAKIRANNTLDATLSGSGDVLYKGNPTITSEETGDGQLIDSN